MGFALSALNLLGRARGTPGASGSSSDRPYAVSRYMGGQTRFNHPYVSGYWYIIIEPPGAIFGTDSAESSLWLHSTAEGFTPPTRTMTKVDIPGIGGLGSSFVAGQQLTRTFSTTFREYQDTPILNTVNRWTSMIDHHFGLSPFAGDEYIPANYKGTAWAFLCKPTSGPGASTFDLRAEDLEQLFFFEGVFPESPPFDGFNSDISTNDAAQLNITWSFDGWPQGKENPDTVTDALARFDTIVTLDTLILHDRNHHQSSAIMRQAPLTSRSKNTGGG